MLYGARKQIFITFGPWVLVEVFKQPVATMTLLFFIVAVIGIFVKPWIGHLIDKVGERAVLSTEAFLFFSRVSEYAFAEDLFRPSVAIAFIYVCYITDFTLDSVYMARITYMKKIALKPEDMSPSLSLERASITWLPCFSRYSEAWRGPKADPADISTYSWAARSLRCSTSCLHGKSTYRSRQLAVVNRQCFVAL